MPLPVLKSAFSAGEMAPSLYGSVDLAKYAQGLSTCRNCFVSYRGGILSRAGTAYVGRSLQTGLPQPPRLIPFQFSLNQGYALEFGNQYMRVISRGAYVTETATTITGATQADPCVISDSGQSYNNGDWVFLSGIGGMTQLNGQTFIVASRTSSGFALHDLDGNPIDSTGYGAYTSGGAAARIFTLPTPYAAIDLPLLKFAQSADVMSLTHPNYAPQELSRLGPANWTIAALTPGGSELAAPYGLTATASNTTTTNPASYSYVVTAVDASGNESRASGAATVTNSVNMSGTAGSINLAWNPVSSAQSYNIYRAPVTFGGAVPAAQIFGYIGTSLAPIYADTNTVPDFSLAPPQQANPFAPGAVVGFNITSAGSGGSGLATVSMNTSTGSGFAGYGVISNGALVGIVVQNGGQEYAPTDTATVTGSGLTGAAATPVLSPATGTYPGCVAYFQTRRAYASTANNPDTLFFSRPGQYTNFDTSIPVADDDAITTTPWAQQVNGVNWMIPMPGGLVVGTGVGAWQVEGPNSFGANQQPITPANVQAIPQAQNGFADYVPPIRVNYDIVYVQGKGSTVRDLQYNFFVSIYTGTDLSLLSSHLFLGHSITQWAWCEEPYKLIWAVRDDGIMLSLTYLKEQEIWGWARHDTQGSFLSVCAVSEPLPGEMGLASIDALYCVVERTVNGAQRYYVERMDNRIWQSLTAPWCVDCGLSYSGALTATVTGLQHLEGRSVVGLADGVAVGPLTVSATGSVVLPFAAANVTLGLSYTPQIQTLYLDAGQPTIQGRRKSIYAVTVRTTNSCKLQVGTNQPDGAAQFPPQIAPAWSNMTAMPDQGAAFTTAGGGTGITPYTGDVRVAVSAAWQKPGQIAVQQVNPLPLEIVDLVAEFLPGDLPEGGITAARAPPRGGAAQAMPAAP